VGFLTIFKFSTRREQYFMLGGTLTAILAGITFPFFLMYFGQITDLFVDPATAVEKGLDILYKFLLIGSLYWVLSTVGPTQPSRRWRAGATRGRPNARG
jgi:hypothetical protein